MSIILKAFPLGFLINHDYEQNTKKSYDLKFERENLNLIKVATNMKLEDVNFIMENLKIPYKYKNDKYILNNGLCVQWTSYQGHYCAFITPVENKFFRKLPPNFDFTKQTELLFKNFDVILKRNTRNVNSKEIFYYCYKTKFKTRYDILEELKKQKIENITRNTENEVRFRYNNKNYKFKRDERKEPFYIESEQKISLVDIISGRKNVTTRSLKTNFTNKEVLIKTLEEHDAKNIHVDELNIYCELNNMQLWYSKNNEESAYNLEADKIVNEDECTQLLEDLESEYGLNIQDLTYKKILERIKNQNMRLESEHVDEDNSIVLTIDLG